jgi:hypothetical protein
MLKSFPLWRREAVKKFIKPSRNFVKSPLTPLFQRGEPKTGVLWRADSIIFLSTSVTSPFGKRGIKGDFVAD